MQFTAQIYRTYDLITAPKIHTDLLWDLTLLFLGIAFLYFLAIFLFKKQLSKRSNKTKKIKQEIAPMISEFIFLEEDATKDEKSSYVNLKVEIRELIKSAFYRKTVTEILMDLRKDVSGTARKRLFELFKDLGLHQESYKKLHALRWERISKGIIELTQMRVQESYGLISKFINDKRPTIRKQAEIAVVTLKPEGINHFLDTTKHRISEWQQLKLMEVLSNKENFLPPSFRVWLTSKNKFVVLFALRLIKHYDQNDAYASITELVKHKNNRIKQEAIDCIKTFHITDAIPTLKTVFWKCSVNIKIALLDAIGNLGEKEDLPFLKLIENKESSFPVRSKALAAINMIAPETVLPTEGIVDTKNYNIPKDIRGAKMETMPEDPTIDEYRDTITPENTADTSTDDNSETMLEVDVISDQGDADLVSIKNEKQDDEIAPISEEPGEAIVENTQKVTGTSLSDEKKSIDQDHKTESISNTYSMKDNHEPKDPKPNDVTKNVSESSAEDESSKKENMEAPTEIQPAFSIAFLPVVIDGSVGTDETETTDNVETTGETDDVVDIKVDFELLAPIVEDTKEITEERKPIRFDVTDAEMYFIPIVENPLPSVTDQYSFADTRVQTQTDLKELEVVDYNEIIALENAKKPGFVDAKELVVRYEAISATPEVKTGFDINELPVVYDQVLGNGPSDNAQNNPAVNTIAPEVTEPMFTVVFKDLPERPVQVPLENTDVNEITVSYEEIKSIALDQWLPVSKETEFKEEPTNTPLDHDMDAEIANSPDTEDDIASNETEETAEESIAEQDIAEQQLPSWLLKEIEAPEETTDKTTAIKMEGPEWEAKTSKMIHDINYYLQYLPSNKKYDSDMVDTMQLLDDIDFFGDERELPLLDELMQKEKKEAALVRIKDIMARFQGNAPLDDGNATETEGTVKNNEPYSIFQEFFRHCDTDSKLILLDEIVAVGDHKEVYFLGKLLSDPERRIRRKAAKTLKELKERLGMDPEQNIEKREQATVLNAPGDSSEGKIERLLGQMDIQPPKEKGIFDIDFELLGEEAPTTVTGPKAKKKSGSVRDSIFKLFQRTNKKK
ncbi:hypothetical protein [Maribacter sp. 2-571]|uniref:HEAT repeat domain-containing protein n=1 Tax=Maribacter sp. 2-571 TaxID=3417569 RepID=UPI003D339971